MNLIEYLIKFKDFTESCGTYDMGFFEGLPSLVGILGVITVFCQTCKVKTALIWSGLLLLTSVLLWNYDHLSFFGCFVAVVASFKRLNRHRKYLLKNKSHKREKILEEKNENN